MGLLFIGALAGILISFGWLAPSQGYLASCASQPCFDRATIDGSLEAMPATLRPAPAIAKAMPTRSGKSSSAKQHAPVRLAKLAPPRTKLAVSPSDPAAETSDAVMNKARASIAAQMDDPGSVEFSDIKRAIRNNVFGRPVDTICGHVKGKNASGAETGERPFLYLVKEDDAYVVDSKPNSAASIAYRNICK